MEETIYDSFELLYLYVENIRCFESQEFVFTTEYNIKYDKDTRELNIEERHDKDYLKGFFGPNISNINVIVGKNGSGKSTILQLLGGTDKNYISTSKWFTVYKTNIKNSFYVEGHGEDIFEHNSTIKDNSKSDDNYYFNFVIDNSKKQFNFNINIKNTSYIFNYKKILINQFSHKKLTLNFNDITPKKSTHAPPSFLKRKQIKNINLSELYYLINKYDIFQKMLNLETVPFHFYFIDSNLKNELENIYKLCNDNENISEVEFLHLYMSILLLYYISMKKFSLKNFPKTNEYNDILDFKKVVQQLLEQRLTLIDNNISERNLKTSTYLIVNNLIDSLTNMYELNSDPTEPINFFNVYLLQLEYKYMFLENTFKFIESYDIFNRRFNILFGEGFPFFFYDFGNNISEGELKLISVYSSIYKCLIESTGNTNIIILDEPDQAMHPDWISKFISNLTLLTNYINKNKEINTKYQFLISTHSPFMLSDIPKEFITTIDIQEDEDGKHIRVVDKPKLTFASNYYDIIKDSFFLDNTMGTFALNKIRNIHEILYDSLSQIKNNNPITKQQVLDKLTKQVYISSEDNLLKIIDTIGEPLIRMQLHNLWNELNKQWSTNTSSFVKTLSNEEKEKLYDELKKELDK